MTTSAPQDREIILAAVLAGRCANGFERGGGSVVHAVPATEQERVTGIRHYARSLCGKTHGARSAGWSHWPTLVVNCPRCAVLEADPEARAKAQAAQAKRQAAAFAPEIMARARELESAADPGRRLPLFRYLEQARREARETRKAAQNRN
jgi:hypothetical protein